MTQITIRPLHSLDEMYEAVDLQQTYWGTDLESIVPAHMLFTIASYGGHVLAAFDETKMIGVLIGLIGTNIHEVDRPAMANLLVASKRMVVLQEYRNAGVGYKLKLAQREQAIRQGIRLVTWTFDPLLAMNANLNLRKLGGICQTYLIDYYGTSERSGLATLGASDRLVVEWWVTNRRVEERLSGTRTNVTLAQYLDANASLINPGEWLDNTLHPGMTLHEAEGTFALLEIPLNYTTLVKEDEGLAQAWQRHLREAFTDALDKGFIVTDFLRGQSDGRERAFYLLSFSGGFESGFGLS
ncbi:MAG: hypothetical protein SF029_14120 [bacterium]|nr:hypothetical protein [bacterium]